MSEPSMNPEPPPLANRRPGVRKRSFLGCTVVYGDGAHSFACVIRDIAPTGARIGFEAGHSMPSSFWLINSRDRTAHKAKIAALELSTRDEIAQAAAAGDSDKVAELQERLGTERKKSQAGLEEQKEAVRRGKR